MAYGILPSGALEKPASKVLIPLPDKTYALDVSAGGIIGHCEGAQALIQAIYKILNTPQSLIIYSNYGCSVEDLINADRDYLQSELKRRITAALSVDSRVEKVSDFVFVHSGSEVDVSFVVHSNIGVLNIDRRWSLA